MTKLHIPLLLLTLCSCGIFGDRPTDVGVYGRVYVTSPDPNALPLAMVWVSTRGVLAWGQAEAVAELYDAAGVDLREPWNYAPDRAVWRPFEGDEWEGDVAGRVFPRECSPAFRGDEVTRWRVTFFDTLEGEVAP